MNVLAVISPGLKVLFERVGKPEVINRPEFLRFGRRGAVIACGGQPMDGLRRLSKAAPLHGKRGVVQFNAVALGLKARRFLSD
jgi:hypothetical protein